MKRPFISLPLLLLSLVAIAFTFLGTGPPLARVSFAQGEEEAARPKDARYYSDQAVKAYKEKNYAAYLENMKMALELRPNHPRLMYNLAGAHALAGNKAEAVALLARVAEMGLIYAADRDGDFDSIKESDAFKAVLKRFENNRAPVNHSTTAFTMREKGLVTEGIAYDPASETFYVSSVHKRKIVSIAKDGAAKDFATERDGLWSVLGMKVDSRRRHLWATSAAIPQMMNYSEADAGRAAIFKFDLRTGKLLKKYLLPGQPKKHLLGDLVINSRGDVFATDSLTPALYTIEHRKDDLEAVIEGEPFVAAQGLDFSPDEKRLFVADYARGIFIIDLRTRKHFNLNPAPGSTLLGIDGLYRYKRSLIATQNGTNPQRIIRLHLDKSLEGVERLEVLEANNPLFDEPTLGVLVRDAFYYIANSQWGAVDQKGALAPAEKLREPVILKVRL
ncbi:MAG TPA: hypothetical protein VGX92_11890 [Pyrinomonadaceae bacterium]|jgi:hypothetical protein|nr:hypothetical protein [Pyrinomonadaceae bacterium]